MLEITKFSPSQVLAIEKMRIAPFCSTLGCCENEKIAWAIVAYLAEHGDSWTQPVDIEVVRKTPYDWDVPDGDLLPLTGNAFMHTHAGIRCKNGWLIRSGIVSDDFIRRVMRTDDGTEFRADIIEDLLRRQAP